MSLSYRSGPGIAQPPAVPFPAPFKNAAHGLLVSPEARKGSALAGHGNHAPATSASIAWLTALKSCQSSTSVPLMKIVGVLSIPWA
jgi:hypothetical protein